jgi:hypothetical protein
MKLSYSISQIDSLTPSQLGAMYELMNAHYLDISIERFNADLEWKDEVILLHDQSHQIKGFSTIAWNPCNTATSEYDILFSGDTIIHKEHWGTQELVRGFCHRAGEWKARHSKKIYWYLISKGYRTYLYLPLFAKKFHPSPYEKNPELERIAATTSSCIFGDAWKTGEGLIRFPSSHGRLTPQLADDIENRMNNPYVSFFNSRNPRFSQGEELVCITEMTQPNLKRMAALGFEGGLSASQESGT